MRCLLPLLLLGSGCLGPTGSGEPGDVLHGEPPNIESFTWGCSLDEETWTFDATTSGWTGNGRLYLARAADYVESHAIRSVEAAGDGSADHLALTLDIVADWRDASSGGSTAFQCNSTTESELCLRLVVYAPGTDEVADCVDGGASPTVLEGAEGVPSCGGGAETG